MDAETYSYGYADILLLRGNREAMSLGNAKCRHNLLRKNQLQFAGVSAVLVLSDRQA